jgi:LysM repeat protein
VRLADALALIAAEFHSTVNDVLEVNELKDPNAIYVG